MMGPRALLRRCDPVDVLVALFFVGIGVVGVLGVTGYVSVSASEQLISPVAVALWCACYMVSSGAGVVAQFFGWRRVEGSSLIAAAGATLLHGYFLVDVGAAGVQTGARLLSGIPLVLALALIAFRESRSKPLERIIAQVLKEKAAEARGSRGDI